MALEPLPNPLVSRPAAGTALQLNVTKRGFHEVAMKHKEAILGS